MTSSIAIRYVQQDLTEFDIQLLPSHKSLVVSVLVDGVNLDMEVASVCLVSEAIFRRLWPHSNMHVGDTFDTRRDEYCELTSCM